MLPRAHGWTVLGQVQVKQGTSRWLPRTVESGVCAGRSTAGVSRAGLSAVGGSGAFVEGMTVSPRVCAVCDGCEKPRSRFFEHLSLVSFLRISVLFHSKSLFCNPQATAPPSIMRSSARRRAPAVAASPRSVRPLPAAAASALPGPPLLPPLPPQCRQRTAATAVTGRAPPRPPPCCWLEMSHCQT